MMKLNNKFLNLILGLPKVHNDENDSDTLADMYKNVLTIAWPAALEGLLLSLMNSFDTMMVGKLGYEAITSVGLCAQPRMLLLLLAQSLCIGTTAVVARRKGAGDRAAAVSCLQQSLAIITLLGILMTFVGYTFAEPLLRFAGAGDDTIANAVIYFRITTMPFLLNCLSLCICAAQRGVGKTKITMGINMTANVVNVFFNYCLINGRLGFPALGVRGAAIATALGTVTGSIIAITVVCRKDGYLSLRPFRMVHFDKQTISSLIKVGSGSVAESVFMRLGFIINGKLIAGVSTAAFATNQIVSQVCGLTFTLGDGISSACTSLVGQSLGAWKKEKAKCYVAVGGRICVFVSIVLMTFSFTCRSWLPTLFTEDAQIIYASSLCFAILVFGIPMQNVRVMYSGCLRGAGDVKYVAMVSLISVTIIRPLTTWFCCYILNGWFPGMMFGFIGAWISFDVDSIVRASMMTHRIKQGKWVNVEL